MGRLIEAVHLGKSSYPRIYKIILAQFLLPMLENIRAERVNIRACALGSDDPLLIN